MSGRVLSPKAMPFYCWSCSHSRCLRGVLGLLQPPAACTPMVSASALGGAGAVVLIRPDVQGDLLTHCPKADCLGGNLCFEAALATV